MRVNSGNNRRFSINYNIHSNSLVLFYECMLFRFLWKINKEKVRNNKYKNNKNINPHGNFVKKPTWLFLQEFFQNLKDQKFLKISYIVTKHIRFKKLLF